jgi:hypothetical protein
LVCNRKTHIKFTYYLQRYNTNHIRHKIRNEAEQRNEMGWMTWQDGGRRMEWRRMSKNARRQIIGSQCHSPYAIRD